MNRRGKAPTPKAADQRAGEQADEQGERWDAGRRLRGRPPLRFAEAPASPKSAPSIARSGPNTSERQASWPSGERCAAAGVDDFVGTSAELVVVSSAGEP